ncbi:MAG: NifU family protein [Firmicutes bacterium]|jgi:Fe-S cluster biogenesis protein NfuA|nr:NifU family protein [Bacillota bacterium]
MDQQTMVTQVNTLITKVRPYLQRDGGDIEIISIDDGIVYVKMLGACDGCMAIDITLKQGIETMLLENVPGIIGVVMVEE